MVPLNDFSPLWIREILGSQRELQKLSLKPDMVSWTHKSILQFDVPLQTMQVCKIVSSNYLCTRDCSLSVIR